MNELLNDDNYFAQIDTKIVKQIKSKHSIWLYEVLCDYKKIGTRNLTIEQVRILAGLNKNQYPKVSELTKQVINKAVKEVNDKTDFSVGYKTTKKGRSIISYDFHFSSKEKREEKKLFRDFLQDTFLDKPIDLSEQFGVEMVFKETARGLLMTDNKKKTNIKKELAFEIYEWFYENIERITTNRDDVKRRGQEAFDYWKDEII